MPPIAAMTAGRRSSSNGARRHGAVAKIHTRQPPSERPHLQRCRRQDVPTVLEHRRVIYGTPADGADMVSTDGTRSGRPARSKP